MKRRTFLKNIAIGTTALAVPVVVVANVFKPHQITLGEMRRATRELARNTAPIVDGSYIAVSTHPDMMRDIAALPSKEGPLVTNGDFATDSDWTTGDGWRVGEPESGLQILMRAESKLEARRNRQLQRMWIS